MPYGGSVADPYDKAFTGSFVVHGCKVAPMRPILRDGLYGSRVLRGEVPVLHLSLGMHLDGGDGTARGNLPT